MAPHVLIDPDHGDAVEAARVVDQDVLALGQDGVVGGVPRDPESFGNAGDGEVLAHDRLQRPPLPTPRELRPRLGRPAGVFAPHMSAASAGVAADRHNQGGGPPPQWLVGELPGDGVTRHALTAAAATPALGAVVGIDDPAREHRSIRFESLTGHDEAELVEAAERGQVRASEGSVRHVEVLWMGSVGTPIIGGPRRLCAAGHANPATPSSVKSRIHCGQHPLCERS